VLKLIVHLSESWDDDKSEFIFDDFVLELEHSLVSISKWESRFEKPFLDKNEKTNEEVEAYVRYMILNEEYPANILDLLSEKNVKDINAYIDSKQSGTTFNEPKTAGAGRANGEKITAELIYYWMTSYRIPWEAQYWHLNRLFTLIKVFNVKSEKPKPMSKTEAAAQRRALNDQRRAQYHTNG
jgi:hypothetical protein